MMIHFDIVSLSPKLLAACLLLLQSNILKGDENLSQCSCQKKEIQCRSVEDSGAVKVQLYLVNKICNAARLRLINSRIPALPHGLLQGSKFTEIHIVNSTLPFLSAPFGGENPLIGGEHIEKFTLEEVSYPYNWNWSILNICRRLKELRIKKSSMIYIGPLFRMMNLTSLKTLRIEKSDVKWISEGAFAHLKGIAIFHLIDNRFETFKRNLLPDPAENLNALVLRGNALDYIEKDLFHHMPELTYVNLENNNLVTIFEMSGFFVSLSGNPFRCDCSIQWLKESVEFTDIYRLRCYMPEKMEERVLVKKVDFRKMGC